MAFVGSLSGSGGASNTINVTGSMIIANPGTGGLFPSFPGTDTVFFVSGARDGKEAGSRTVAVFGGDTVVSGSLTIGTGSIRIDSNEIRFQGGIAKIVSGTGGLTFFDSGSPSGVTLTTLAAGGGGTGTNFFYDTDGNAQVYTTGSVAFVGVGADLTNNIRSPADKGTDLFFYVSGSTDGTATALFGGDVVTSGSVTVRDGASALSITAGASNGTVITAITGDLLLNSLGEVAGNTRVIVQTELEVQGEGILAGSGGGARGIFTDNVTQANLITIGGVGGKTTVAGELQVTSGYISGSTGVNLALGSGGDVTVAGDLTVTGNDIKSSTGATAITLSGGNVIIPGDLTVNGTTTTVNTDNLVVRDQLIYIASASAAGTVTYGGLAIASGSGTANEALVFVKDGGAGTGAVWSAGRQDVVSGTVTSNAGLTYLPIRASSFQLGGTLSTAVASDSAYVSSSDALNVLVNHKASTTFAKNEVPTFKIGTFDPDGAFPDPEVGAIFGMGGTLASPVVGDLWISGSRVDLAHSLVGGVKTNGIGIVGGDTLGGLLRITKSGATPTFNVEARDSAGGARDLVVTGSTITIGAHSSATGITFAGANTNIANLSAASSTTPSFVASQTNATFKVGTGGGTTDTLIISGTAIQLNAGASGQSFRRDNSEFLLVSSGTYVTPAGTESLNAAKIVPGDSPVPHDVLLGASSGKSLFLSGTGVEVNHGNASTFSLFTDGAEYLRFSTGPGLGTLIGGQVAGRNVSLTAAGAGKMILSGSTTTLSGSSIDFVNDSTKVAFFGTSGNSSGLIPNATNTFDLGTPDFRWRNMYTGDLHLKNERGDWTVIEEEDFLTLTNNKSGKRYKFVVEEI